MVQGFIQLWYEHLWDWRETAQRLWGPCPSAGPSSWGKCLRPLWIALVSIYAHFLLPSCHAPLCLKLCSWWFSFRRWGLLLVCPKLSLFLSGQAQLLQPLFTKQMLQHHNIITAFCWTWSGLSVSVLYRVKQNWTWYSICGLKSAK